MPSPPRRVVVTQHNFDDAAAAFLRASRCEVVLREAAPGRGDAHFSYADLVSLLDGAGGWIVGHAKVTRELLSARPDLLIVSRRGVGYDGVDVAAGRDLHRVVTIAAGGNDDSVADHTLGLALGLLRRIRESQLLMERGGWSILVGSDLNRKTVGILGFGRIARTLVKRLSGFEAKVLVCAGPHHADAIRSQGADPVDLHTLLAESDILTLHAPLTSETRFIIDAAAISRMKSSAILINTSRGGLVQDADLLEALRAGRLAGAGLDVFLSETDASARHVTDALIGLPNVLATPHAAASSRESLARTSMIAAENVVTVFDGGVPPPSRLVVDGRPR